MASYCEVLEYTRKHVTGARSSDGWHAWSLQHRGVALRRIAKMAESSPSSISEKDLEMACAVAARGDSGRAELSLLTTLDAGEKAALADFFLDVSAHAEPQLESGKSRATFGDGTACRDGLLALVDKLGVCAPRCRTRATCSDRF